ncbi:Uncharacterised protein [Aggregatibacter aphrophilus]|uniref:Uncharacterized protein n=1 Tax=Aggregatibacter aphrophilus TaxID=732 RepID=A0A336N410_AGGAP|nr:Uncharacterised protein [Aggregatibacter aphrophilus]
MQETMFFHRLSRTLILADLIENFETDKFGSCLWANIMKLTGISSPDGKAPADWRATFKDKTAARESLAQILAWQPEKSFWLTDAATKTMPWKNYEELLDG